MVGINTIIVQAIVDALKASMQTPFLETDDTRLNYIGVGKLQANPNDSGVFVLVRPSTDTHKHEFAENVYIKNVPMGLIGSQKTTSFYLRRYTLEIGMFFQGDDEDPEKDGFWESMEKSDLVYGRLKHAIATMPMPSQISEFGESVIYPPVVFSEFAEESGSKNGKNNYRGDVVIDFFTRFDPI